MNEIGTKLDPDGDLLLPVAHPDDESNFAAFAALTALAGHRVYIACLTRGEAGLGGSKLNGRGQDPAKALGLLRSIELQVACRALGAEPPIIMDLGDNRLHELDPAAIAEEHLMPIIDRVKPKRIMRFQVKDGMTGHPDHVISALAAGIAHEQAAPTGCELWQGVPTPAWASEEMRGVRLRGTPLLIPGGDLATLDLRLDKHAEALRRRQAVYAAHRSQHASLRTLMSLREEAYQFVAVA